MAQTMTWANGFTIVLILATTSTALCKPYGLSVSDIRATSVVLHWHSTETTVEEFKIQCTGTRQYETENGEQVTSLDTVTHYAPKGSDHVLIANMKENFNYSCIITEDTDEGTQILGSRTSDPYHFATDYGVPEQPRSPVVHTGKDHIVTIKLFQTSTKFGPIHGYEVQFHLINGWTSDDQPFIDPEDMIVDQLMSMEDAQESIDPVPFKISYNSSALPDSITINENLLYGALKNGVMYTVITVAYTIVEEVNNESAVLSTESVSSRPFSAIGIVSASSLGLETGSSSQLILAIGLGVALPLVVLGYLLCVGAVIYCHEMRLRKQKAFTRSDIINARKAQQQDSQFQATTTGDLPWLDPLIGNSNRQTPSSVNSQPQNSSSNQSTVSVTVEVHESPESSGCSNTQVFNESIEMSTLSNNATGPDCSDMNRDNVDTGEQETMITIQNEAVESETNIDSQHITLSIEPELSITMDTANSSIQGTSAGDMNTLDLSQSMKMTSESHSIVTISEEELSSSHAHETTSLNQTNNGQSYISTNFSQQRNESTHGSTISDEYFDSTSSLYDKATPVLVISPDNTSTSQTLSSLSTESQPDVFTTISGVTDPETADLSALILMSSKSSMLSTTTPSTVSSETTIFSRTNSTRLEPQSDHAMYSILSTDCYIHGPIISCSSASQSNGSVQKLSSCPVCSQPSLLDSVETERSLETSDINTPSQQQSIHLSNSSDGSSSINFKASLFADTSNGSSNADSSEHNKTLLPVSSVNEPGIDDVINSESANLISTTSQHDLLPGSNSSTILNHCGSNVHTHVEEYSESSEQLSDSLKVDTSPSLSQQHDESPLCLSQKSKSTISLHHSSTRNFESDPSVLSVASTNSVLSYHSALGCSEKHHCMCGTTGIHDHSILHAQTSNHSSDILNGNHSSTLLLTSSSDSFFIPAM